MASASKGDRDFVESVLETVQSLVMVMGRDGRILRFNRSCEQLSGFPRGEVIGRSVWEVLVPAGDAEQVRGEFSRIAANELPAASEHRWITRAGDERLIAWSNSAMVDASGRIQHVIATGIDVTEQRRAERALRRVNEEMEQRIAERTAQLAHANQALSLTQFAVDHAVDAVFWMTADRRFRYVNDAACRFLGYTREALLGLAFDDVNAGEAGEGTPPSPGARDAHTFESRFRRSDGSLFPVEVTAYPLDYDGGNYLCVFARDVTGRRRAEALRQEQLMAARTLSSISSRFVVAMEDVHQAIVDALEELAQVLEANCVWLMRKTANGLVPEWKSRCWQSGCPLPNADFYREYLRVLEAGEVVVKGDPALVIVPLFAEGVLSGLIAFDGARQVERWREGDFPLLRVAARVITGAIQRHRAELQTMRLLEENRRLARQSIEIQERERAHLARELHDELGQCLTAIRADAQSIMRLTRDSDPRVHASAEAIGDVASGVYEVVRNIMRRLRPEMLDELGLGEALREMIEQWRTRHPTIAWELHLPDNLDGLAEPVQLTAYRLVQEGVTNVVKHADAQRVIVRVERNDEGGLEVSVIDDGLGSASAHGGFGLIGMRERVSSVGGRFEASNRPGRGFRIRATFPGTATLKEAAHEG